MERKFKYWLGWACYQIYTISPWVLVKGKFGLIIVPWAGYYANHDLRRDETGDMFE